MLLLDRDARTRDLALCFGAVAVDMLSAGSLVGILRTLLHIQVHERMSKNLPVDVSLLVRHIINTCFS